MEYINFQYKGIQRCVVLSDGLDWEIKNDVLKDLEKRIDYLNITKEDITDNSVIKLYPSTYRAIFYDKSSKEILEEFDKLKGSSSDVYFKKFKEYQKQSIIHIHSSKLTLLDEVLGMFGIGQKDFIKLVLENRNISELLYNTINYVFITPTYKINFIHLGEFLEALHMII